MKGRTEMHEMETDVVIVGYGPVGATAANFLGQEGVRVVVVERDPSVYPRARAISTDEEVLRQWQRVGLAERLKSEMLAGRAMDFVDKGGRSFLDWKPVGRRNGHPAQLFIYQPAVDHALREGVERFDNVELLLEYEMCSVEQDGDGATVTVAALHGGEASTIRAKYVLACDGGKSPTRTQLGIGFEGKTYEDPWLVIDTKVIREWPDHDRLRFWCDPERPAVDCPTPLGHHRWEFPVLPGEDREQLASEESVWQLLGRHGIGPEDVEVLRHVVYVHHVRFADQWRVGRIFLMGDAAHVMPPWIGQGMASGVRDAGNLCWKLAAVIRDEADDALLDSYEIERQPHVREVTKQAVFFGRIITERKRGLTVLRNHLFRVLMRLPGIGSYFRDGKWFPDIRLAAGSFVADQEGATAVGLMAPQPFVATADQDHERLDDVLGSGWSLVTKPNSPGIAAESVKAWESIGARHFELVAEAPGEGQLADLDGWLTDFMTKHQVDALVLRPDHIVYAVAAAGKPLPAPSSALHPIRKAVSL